MEKKNIVFHFKNQSDSRQHKFTDYRVLKNSINMWHKNVDIKAAYIIGEYTNEDIAEIKEQFSKEFEKYNLSIINIKNPMTYKWMRINYQVLKAYEYLKEPFISAHIDVFPIRKLSDEHFNKEYGIRHRDVIKLYNDPTKKDHIGWFGELEARTLIYFNEKYNTDFKIMYEHHSFYYITKEFIDFFTNDRELFKFNYSTILCLYNQLQGESIWYPDLIGVTYRRNKFVWEKSKEKIYKGINLTLPDGQKSKKIMKKFK